jgi:GH25 family lysozyme M1 (1,4-beta-N-acetylmuramidase)
LGLAGDLVTVQGIDVASYQSATYDTDGLAFAFIKATEGTSYVNPKQGAQAAHGRGAGCVIGFYHFLRPGSVQAQAEYFVERCASQPGDILACDWEPTSSGLASCAEKDAFIRAVKKLRPGHRVVLYCDVSRWKTVDTTSYCGDGLWIADPNHPAGHPSIAAPWLFHQYGIRGTDRDLGNFTDRAALAAWAVGTTPKEAFVADASDVQVLFQTDNVLASPDGDKDPQGNRFWTAESYLRYGFLQDRTTQALVKQLAAKVDAQGQTIDQLVKTVATLASNVGGLDPATIVAELKQAIESIHVSLDVTDPQES